MGRRRCARGLGDELLDRGRAGRGRVERDRISNASIARQLARVADLLEEHDANPFRVRSYRRAAAEVEWLTDAVSDMYLVGGRERLEAIPGVGRALSSSIAEIVETGHLGLLQRLEAERSPADAFRRLPGVGRTLARRIQEELGVDSLEELEIAAHDGRLESVEGIGAKRAQGIRDALAGVLGRSSWHRAAEREHRAHRPTVAVLLDVDREYRTRARLAELRTIAPRRFNPSGEAWLPIMEVERDGWQLKALFSNTARAHELGRTHDWVVIYYHRDGDEGQCTVVTARAGRLRDLRIVRGREPECARHYFEGLKTA